MFGSSSPFGASNASLFDCTNSFQDYQECLLSPQALLSMLLCFLLLYFIYTVIPLSAYYQYPLVFFLRSYSYRPLDNGKKKIWLIELQVPIKSQPLCGNIIQVPLSAELDYRALSYCWGSCKGKRTIILDGKKLQITVNLNDALRQLGNTYPLLWVDAICINQKDIPERSREVLRMGEIYSGASGVAAWLGVADKTSDKAMDFLQVLATKTPRSQYDKYLKDLPSHGTNLGESVAEWNALKDLAANENWSRTWIIQELALCPRSIIVHCGTKILPWEDFVNVFGATMNGGSFNKCILIVAIHFKEDSKVSTGLKNLLEHFTSSDPFLEGLHLRNLNVIQMFKSYSTFLATDPRDKVYGMLGMNVELQELVPLPDYANSKGKVFRDLTKAMLARGYNLDLICLKDVIHINQLDVSWVPNWDVFGHWNYCPAWLLQAIEDNKSRGPYSADGGKRAIIAYIDIGDRSILQVSGISYDKVDGLGSGSAEAYYWPYNPKDVERRTYAVVKPDHSQNVYGTDEEIFKALKELSQKFFHPWAHDAAQEYTHNNECLIPRVYRQRTFLNYGNSDGLVDIKRWLQQTEEFNFADRSLLQWFEMACTHGHGVPLASSSLGVQMDPKFLRMIKTLFRGISVHWRWLSTERGYLGLIHPHAQKGDEIVIVRGCSVPMVLRPCGQQHYRVIGAAYVQGIMNGEALQGVSDDDMRYFDLA